MKDDDGMTTFKKVQSYKEMIRSKVWPNLCVGKHCHPLQSKLLFFLEILEKTVINMFSEVFADGKLVMAWLYINKRQLFSCSHRTDL